MIEYSEFCQACWSKDILKDRETLRIAFEVLDHNGDGYISIDEARVAFSDSNSKSERNRRQKAIWAKFTYRFLSIAVDKDKGVTFPEFEQVMRKVLLKSVHTCSIGPQGVEKQFRKV